MTVNAVVPHNTSAHIILPGAASEDINGSEAGFSACSEGAEAKIGSGSYCFSYLYKI
jgi:hypothetical protein